MNVEHVVRSLAATQDSLITTSQAVANGLSTADIRTRVRRREWRPLTYGVLLTDADLYADGLPPRMWWRAALLSQGPASFLVASTAVRAFGVAGLGTETAIEVAVPGGISRLNRSTKTSRRPSHLEGPTIVVRQLVVPLEEVVEISGLRVRAAAHSLVDTGLNSDRATALSILDSALHLGVITTDQLDKAVVAARGRRGVVALRALADYADARAESPLESRVRLACIDGEIRPDELQYQVRDAHGSLIAVGDLAWLKWRRRPLLAEADGAAVHSLPTAVFKDRRRGNALTASGYDTIRFTWADAMQPHRIVAAVRAALAAA